MRFYQGDAATATYCIVHQLCQSRQFRISANEYKLTHATLYPVSVTEVFAPASCVKPHNARAYCTDDVDAARAQADDRRDPRGRGERDHGAVLGHRPRAVRAVRGHRPA